MSVSTEKETGHAFSRAPAVAVGIPVCDACFVSEKSAVRTAF